MDGWVACCGGLDQREGVSMNTIPILTPAVGDWVAGCGHLGAATLIKLAEPKNIEAPDGLVATVRFGSFCDECVLVTTDYEPAGGYWIWDGQVVERQS